jgi:hypothetical protein
VNNTPVFYKELEWCINNRGKQDYVVIQGDVNAVGNSPIPEFSGTW